MNKKNYIKDKNKSRRGFTLIELIIVIIVIGILAGMALPKFLGIQRDAKVSAMFRDVDTLEKVIMIYYQDNDELPLYDLSENTFNVSTTLNDTLNRKNDDVTKLKVINKSKLKNYLSKNTKYGKDANENDEYLYSELTGNVYYSAGLQNGKGITYHTYENAQGDPIYRDEDGNIVSLIKEVKFGNSLLTSNRTTISEEPTNNFTGLITKGTTLQVEINGVDISNEIQRETIGKEEIATNSLFKTVKAAEEEYEKFTLPATLDETAINKVKMKMPEDNKTVLFLVDFAAEDLLEAPDIDIDILKTPYELIVNYPNGVDISETQYIIDSSEAITTKPDLTPLMDGLTHIIEVRYKTTDNKFSEWANVSFTYKNETPIPDKKYLQISSILLGSSYSMTIASDNNVYSWGINNYGQLGIGSKISKTSPTKVNLPAEFTPKYIKGVGSSTIIVGEDGSAYSFGRNNLGQLGIGNNIEQVSPVKMILPSGVTPKEVALGNSSGIFIGNDDNLYSWGYMTNTNLGYIPKKIELPSGVKPKTIDGGFDNFFMIIGNDGQLYVLGNNSFGQLGTGNNINFNEVTQVSLPNGIKPKSIHLGGQSSLVLGEDDNLYATGRNMEGQLGINNTTSQNVFQKVQLPTNVKPLLVEAGDYFSTMIGSDGNLYVWGGNGFGQLGLGDYANKTIPQLVNLPDNTKPKSIVAGAETTMIIGENNKIYVAGYNKYRQIAPNEDYINSFVEFNQLSNIKIQ